MIVIMKQTLQNYLTDTLRNHWDRPAFTDLGSSTFRYGDVARQMAILHLFYRQAGIRPGDKIAVCGKNSSRWAMAFLSIIAYGGVAVPLLHEFTPDSIHQLVSHSGSHLLFTTRSLWEQLDFRQMSDLDGVILLDDFSPAHFKQAALHESYLQLDRQFASTYPNGFGIDNLAIYSYGRDELVLINYTSGTTAASKGVMLPERSLSSNMAFAQEVLPMLTCGQNVVSILPMAHMYGMAFEFLYEFVSGIHVHFLTRALSPQSILQAMKEVRPALIIAVPLIIEKIVKKGIFPVIHTRRMRILRRIPGIKTLINHKIRQKLMETLGGNFYEVIVGGAAFNREVEQLLHEIGFPFTVGYGMTECAPIIGYRDWHSFVPESCGQPAPRMEIRIDSPDPQNIPGEILTRGDNVMLGYYKNEEATRLVLDETGWLHTGDMGVMDEDNNLFIKGRCKNMLLGPSGQNIYPEEIEDAVSNLPYVIETVVVQRNTKLIALIYPDYATAAKEGHRTDDSLLTHIEKQRKALNATLPSYAQLSGFELVKQEFEKTPKKSIKRFLYK